MLKRRQCRARGEHPAGKNLLALLIMSNIDNFEEGDALRRFLRRIGTAVTHGDFKGAEMNRFIEADFYG